MLQTMQSSNFYNALAEDYDLLTGRRGIPETVQARLERLAKRYLWRRVVDAACGTGQHTIALALLDVEAVGVDSSERMIQLARREAAERGLRARFEIGDFRYLDRVVGTGWDAVICLGNSIAHLQDDEDLRKTLSSFCRCLGASGSILIQMLNYPLLMRRGERIIAISRSGPREFVRFNDYLDNGRVRFNVLRIDWSQGKATYDIISTELSAFSPERLVAALEEIGFGELEIWSDLEGNPFDPDRSRDLVLVARRASPKNG